MEKKDDKKENTKTIGEFIPSYFNWILPEDQKRIADELDKKTK